MTCLRDLEGSFLENQAARVPFGVQKEKFGDACANIASSGVEPIVWTFPGGRAFAAGSDRGAWHQKYPQVSAWLKGIYLEASPSSRGEEELHEGRLWRQPQEDTSSSPEAAPCQAEEGTCQAEGADAAFLVEDTFLAGEEAAAFLEGPFLEGPFLGQASFLGAGEFEEHRLRSANQEGAGTSF